MKKLLTLFILSALAIGLVGCGEPATNEVTSPTTKGGGTSEYKQDTKEADKGTSTSVDAGTE